MNAGVFFDFCDQGPIRFAFVQLRAGPAMYGEGFDADILQSFRHLFNILRLVVPAQAGLHRHRQPGAFYDRFRKPGHSGNILQHGSTGAFTNHFLHRTPEIDVHQVRLYGVYDPGAHGHGLFVAAEYLDAERAFVFKEIQFLPAFNGIPDQSFTGNEFTVHQVSAILFADVPEGRVAHIFHGGEEKRECRNLYIADVYHGIKAQNYALTCGFPNVEHMSNNLKIHSPWSQLALFMGLLGLSLILGVLGGSAIVLAKTGISAAGGHIDLNDPNLIPAKKLAQAFSTVIIFGIPAFFYARQTFRVQPLRSLGLRPAGKTIFFVLGIILLLAALPLEGWLGMLNKQIPLPGWMIRMEKENDQQIAVYLQVHSYLDVVINLFVVAFLPALFEELCFRGALQRILINIFKNPWAGIIVGGAFFSAFHMQFQGFLPRMMLGTLLGAAFWYSGSLWTSIFAHFFFNGIQVIAASYYPKLVNENPSVPAYAGLISLVIVLGLLWLMSRQSTVTYDKVYKEANRDNDFLSN